MTSVQPNFSALTASAFLGCLVRAVPALPFRFDQRMDFQLHLRCTGERVRDMGGPALPRDGPERGPCRDAQGQDQPYVVRRGGGVVPRLWLAGREGHRRDHRVGFKYQRRERGPLLESPLGLARESAERDLRVLHAG